MDFTKGLYLRNYLHSSTFNIKSNEKGLLDEKVSAYVGFDPTAQNLHLGNYLQLITIFRAVEYGIDPILVLGRATGGIGDPSGKSKERVMLSQEDISNNSNLIREKLIALADNIKSFLHNKKGLSADYTIIDNYDFYKEMCVLDFFREFGFNIRINPLLNREAISKRLESEEGMTYTEFSYQLFQSIDYYYLNKDYVI